MSNLDELFELLKEFSDLGTKCQDQLLNVALGGAEVTDQSVNSMEASLDFIGRLKRYFSDLDTEELTSDLDCLFSYIETGLEDPDEEFKEDLDEDLDTDED